MNRQQKYVIRYLALLRDESSPFQKYTWMCRRYEWILNYRDFEYWYLKFQSGDGIIDDQETPPQTKSFGDLPKELVTGICEYLDFESLCRARKVSRTFREIAKDICPTVNTIIVRLELNRIMMAIDVPIEQSIRYYERRPGETRIIYQWITKVMNGDFLELAFLDLEKMMDHRNFKLVNLEFQCEAILNEQNEINPAWNILRNRFNERILEILSHRERRLKVANFLITTYGAEEVCPIISSLEPGTLKKLTLGSPFGNQNRRNEIDMERIVRLEQFAGLIEFSAQRFVMDSQLAISNLGHLQICSLTVSRLAPFSTFMWFYNLPRRNSQATEFCISSVEACNVHLYDQFVIPPLYKWLRYRGNGETRVIYNTRQPRKGVVVMYDAHNIFFKTTPNRP